MGTQQKKKTQVSLNIQYRQNFVKDAVHKLHSWNLTCQMWRYVVENLCTTTSDNINIILGLKQCNNPQALKLTEHAGLNLAWQACSVRDKHRVQDQHQPQLSPTGFYQEWHQAPEDNVSADNPTERLP